ncbi:MAG: glutathione S-transferase [Parasphingorhabdus sp.]|jgi:glutathione S-transferase
MIQFYALPLSSYCSKVRIVLRLKDIAFEEHPPHGGHYSNPAYKKFMPPGTIPAIDHNGFKLFDSDAIVEYLEDLYPEPALRVSDPQVRGYHRALSQFHTTRLEPQVRRLFPLVRSPNVDLLNDVKQAFFYELDRLLEVLDPDPLVGGSRPCLVDCVYPTTLHMAEDVFAFLGQPINFPQSIVEWLEHLKQENIIGDEISKNRRAIAAWLEGI